MDVYSDVCCTYILAKAHVSFTSHKCVRVETLGLCSFIKSTFSLSDLPKNPTKKACMLRQTKYSLICCFICYKARFVLHKHYEMFLFRK